MEKSDYDLYKDGRLIAVLDLQGFSSFVYNIESENSFEKAKRLLKNAKLIQDSREEKREILAELLLKEYPHKKYVDEAINSFECIAISDTIVFSYILNPISLMLLVQEMALLQWDLIWKSGFLSRGYIGFGELYHKNEVIFGKGFIDCFNKCEKNPDHKDPCILIDEELLSLFKGSNDLLKEYFQEHSPGYKRLDYTFSLRRGLSYTRDNISAQDQLSRAMNFINNNLMIRDLKEEIRDKYVFTKMILANVKLNT